MRVPTAVVSIALAALLTSVPVIAQTNGKKPPDRDVAAPVDEISRLMNLAFEAPALQQQDAINRLVKRNNPDAVATLMLALRFTGPDDALLKALSALTGQAIGDWNDAMLWQEAHPEIKPHPSYRDLKLKMYKRIDPAFMRFLGGERSSPQKMRIRLEEIAWGGVRVDGIPSLDNPKLITAAEAGYLGEANLVFGVSINGDSRAYPLRIMGWHEMFNEVIGGVPVALAYCTLCGAGILFETTGNPPNKPFVFGSSGFLYRSNKLMFDRATDSLWNQFTGEPVSGPLVDSGIKLKRRPVIITSWGEWKKTHPDTKVLSNRTGFQRDYGEGVVYREYFRSTDLMFPALAGDESRVRRKDYVFGVTDVGATKAWPLDVFKPDLLGSVGKVINDIVGTRNLVLIGDASTRSVRAYDRGGDTFTAIVGSDKLAGPGGEWSLTEDALSGPGGQKRERVAGHISYWFAWNNYYGVKSALYGKE